ncbi:MAG: dockerin type I repeat-containing protein [Bacteroidaceae bacterium]|nr:dockerin type I repeat-containing protein [Bacteroidaceae bacterium]
MRRYAIFLMLLCVHCIARGQTGFGYRYWFDNDYNTVHTGYSAADKWQIEADLDGLDESLHAIHIQVMDDKGVESTPVTRFFVKARDNSVEQGYYWFDNGRDVKQLVGQVQGTFSIDVSALPEGFHTFYFQVVDKDGSLSSIVARSFYKVVVPESARYRCWVDDEPSTMTVGKYTGAPVLVDVSQISEGYHVMSVQIEGVAPSAVVNRPFVKVPQTEGVEYLKCLSIVDGQLYREENVPSTGGIIDWNFDVSGLPQGFHQMQVQVITPSGAATSTYDAFFLRTTTNAEMDEMRCVYSIDGNEFNTEAGSMSNGVFHCDLDVAHLSDGLHRLTYMLTNGKGVETKIQSQFFIKTPVGGNGITQYWYWLNENEAEKTVVKLKENANPFQLIGLLPVESVPIRSSCFHFEVDEGKGPMLYAKNEFHIRFFDATGRLVDATKPYLDYNVSEKVTGTEEIRKSQTFARPAENGIKWFTLQACEGDTIAFRSSQALSLQVFSPTGKEIYAASGSESVKWGGIHTWEDGTHYVAVHDVTGSQPNVTLDYLHMDKYDVVDQDVRVVGNGGCSTITFYGNGFSDLYAVDWVSASGDTIDAKAIHHESDATVNITFDFTDKTIGKYDGVFHFTTEEKTFADILTVEEATDITLDLKVEYPSTFLHGTYTTYSIEVKNNGNSTAYYVPLEFQIITEPGVRNAISDVKLEGEVPEIDLDWVDDVVMNPDSARCFKEYVRSRGDMQYFIPFVDSISNEDVLDAFFTISIAPNSVYKLDVSVLSTSSVNLRALIPTEWYAITGDINYKARAKSKGTFKEGACCVREKVECFMNVAVAALDFISLINPGLGIADCAANVGNEVLQFAYDVWCGDSNGKTPSEAAKDLRMTCVNTLIGCVAAKMGGDFANLQGVYQHIYNNISVIMDCGRALTQTIPNCPSYPKGGGGTSSPVNSYDPNAIYGYVSPSGSKYIAKDSVETVNYRIEFENDTAFATSSAHVVEIRDTLDARFFELATFAPTYICIGEKHEQLDGTPNFVRTVDMRPQINTVVQVEGQYDEQTGIARWLFTSLDPMTMEPTDDVMQGFLPVNHDGTSGIGDVGYRIGVKKGLVDGTEISNRASIVFDSNEPILTPAWTNIVDGVCPESCVTDVTYKNDSIVTLSIEGSDERSGIWKYDLYVQYGVGAPWIKEAELDADSTEVDFKIYDGLYYGFCTLATDSAGNVEQKLLQPEALCAEIHLGDVNSDGVVNERDAQLTMDYYLEKPVAILAAAADVNEDGVVNTLDVTLIVQMYMNAENAKESAPIIKQYYTIRR